jgi:phosphoglycolate phosphatase
MTEAIFFDMDGTLFQTDLILASALEEVFHILRSEGMWEGEAPIEKYRAVMGAPLSLVWETLCPQHTVAQQLKNDALFQQILIDHITAGRGALYDGVLETLAALSNTYPLYIVSNGHRAYLDAIVMHYGLQRYIKRVYSIDEITSGMKSDLVALAKRREGIQSGYVVGDRLSDIRAAKDNALTAIGVRFDFAQQHELSQADEVIEHFEALSRMTQLVKLS